MIIRNLSVLGLGRLGLPLAASFASGGIRTFGIDVNEAHIDALKRGDIPFQEPGLAELMCAAGTRLTFHTNALGLDADASLIQVPTPSNPDDPRFSTIHVEKAIQTVCEAVGALDVVPARHLVIISSTVMPGTLKSRIKPILDAASAKIACQFQLAYVPDLVALGDVVRGFRHPPCLVIGADDADTASTTEKLYERLVAPDVPHALLSLSEAEMTKVAWNFYFCIKICFANTLLRLADRSGGINVDRVTETLSIDPRVGKGFLKAGMPFGGPCFPRDVDAMSAFMSALSEDTSLATAVSASNENHYAYLLDHILAEQPTSVGILGLAFKAGTSVTVHSPSFKLIERLLEKNIAVCVHDPSPLAAQALAHEPWAGAVHIAQTVEDLCRVVDIAVIAVNDPLYADLHSVIDHRRIIDPWGHVRSTFPGSDKVGRALQRGREPFNPVQK